MLKAGNVTHADLTFQGNLIRASDVHPTDEGYKLMGNIWYGALHDIPSDWIQAPIGPDPIRPDRSSKKGDVGANGGPTPNIPPPDYGTSPIETQSQESVGNVADMAGQGGAEHCNSLPVFPGAGKIAQGLGHNGDWKYHKLWVEAGKAAEGFHRDPAFVSLVDIDGRLESSR